MILLLVKIWKSNYAVTLSDEAVTLKFCQGH